MAVRLVQSATNLDVTAKPSMTRTTMAQIDLSISPLFSFFFLLLLLSLFFAYFGMGLLCADLYQTVNYCRTC